MSCFSCTGFFCNGKALSGSFLFISMSPNSLSGTCLMRGNAGEIAMPGRYLPYFLGYDSAVFPNHKSEFHS